MCKLVFVLAILSVFLIAESTCLRMIQPTYLPGVRYVSIKSPAISRARRAVEDETHTLQKEHDIDQGRSWGDDVYAGDVEFNPYIRTVRSLSTPSVSRGSGSRQSSSRDTGATHPGYNRRNARSIRLPGNDFPLPTLPPFNPRPNYPWEERPGRYPIYAI